MDLARFDPVAFLRDHWQVAPLLLRDPWAGWVNPLDPDELAGLACEEGVESRLITATADGPTLDHGPFAAERLSALGAVPWTLLVQAADQWVPDVAALLAAFRFLPDWRVDDVMVSLACDGGGVGPHVDQYDVFLIQGLGRRRWRIGAPLAEGADEPAGPLRLLPGFEAMAEWVLEPGDILYLPPGVPHDGVAVGDDCMTYSVGLRAPLASALLSHWVDDRLEDMADDRYADPGLAAQTNAGEVTRDALDRLHALALEALGDRAGFARWFGRHTTEPRDPDMDWSPEEPTDEAGLRAALAAGEPLIRNPASRFAFVCDTGGVTLFVAGEAIDCVGDVADLAQRVCAASGPLPLVGPLSDGAVALLVRLVNDGHLAFDED